MISILKYTNILDESGYDREHAIVKEEIQEVRTELKAEIQALRTELKADIHSVTIKLGSLIVICGTLMTSVIGLMISNIK
jgi:hypothetical protein